MQGKTGLQKQGKTQIWNRKELKIIQIYPKDDLQS